MSHVQRTRSYNCAKIHRNTDGGKNIPGTFRTPTPSGVKNIPGTFPEHSAHPRDKKQLKKCEDIPSYFLIRIYTHLPDPPARVISRYPTHFWICHSFLDMYQDNPYYTICPHHNTTRFSRERQTIPYNNDTITPLQQGSRENIIIQYYNTIATRLYTTIK